MPNFTLQLKKPCHRNNCDGALPPPLPTVHHHSLSPLVVVMLYTLAATVSFLCYVAIIKACRTFQKRSRTRSHGNINTNETHHDFVDEEHGSIVFHPIWLINTIGLDQLVIDSIGVFKYKKGNGFMDGSDSDCAVCLGEFQDEESLRILPKCNHAFHVSCIDTWLRSHKNCPVCRAPVVKNTIMNAEIESNPIESNTQDEIPIGDLGNETENTQEIDRNGESLENKCLFGGVRVQSDLMDHRRRQEPEPETMRRSVSMVQLAAGNGDQESKKANSLQKTTKCAQNRSFRIRADVKSESL
ncbi:hypothetical protein L6452_43688 [Arctium lappa]|uniref:Uncharacterized protein n=1 Tax=Arctium lappa TaxID=4217 RepID=A0ACB8XE40_ARCLA|nr:hypothetical protein L6452_43688 [Arctium lappa]